MIREVSGDILDAETEAVVNPVNTRGVMGAGLALQFKRKYPEMYREYVAACRRGEVRVGAVRLHYYSNEGHPRYIFSFPTKQDWRDPSRLSYIDSGLVNLQQRVSTLGISSIAIPSLGCGLGGLDWVEVRKLIEERLGELDVDVVLYPPKPPGGRP